MSACKFPEHHTSGGGGGSGALAGLLLIVTAGALIATHLAAVLIGLAVIAGLVIAGLTVRAMLRSGRSACYDTAWAEPEQRPATFHAEVLQVRVAQLERQLASQQAIEAPAVHQHLHLHCLDADDMAAIITSRQLPGQSAGTEEGG